MVVLREMVSIKGTREGLVILLDTNREFEDLKSYLKRKMESSRGFFRGARFTVYGHAISGYQRIELENICRQYGLIPSPDIHWPPNNYKSNRKGAVGQVSQVASMMTDCTGEPARLVRGILRSGQEIRHRGHVVILGSIHPGAQVIADGNIVIMGACLGTVHAGATGDSKATITALKLNPTRLCIAGITADPAEIPTGENLPLSAKLKNSTIFFEFYRNKVLPGNPGF